MLKPINTTLLVLVKEPELVKLSLNLYSQLLDFLINAPNTLITETLLRIKANAKE
jgi:hypothetical protein